MNSADLITSFFSNEMSPDQEREFLLSVASSDSMRLGLKSHVILDKILVEESNGARIPQQVRQRVFKEVAIVAAGLGGSEAGAKESDAAGDREPVEPSRPVSGQATRRAGMKWITGALALVLCSGSFFAGYTIAEDDGQQAEIGVVTPDTDFERVSVTDPTELKTSTPGVVDNESNATDVNQAQDVAAPDRQAGASEPVATPTTSVSEPQSSDGAANDPDVPASSAIDNTRRRSQPWIDLGTMTVEKSNQKDTQSQPE